MKENQFVYEICGYVQWHRYSKRGEMKYTPFQKKDTVEKAWL